MVHWRGCTRAHSSTIKTLLSSSSAGSTEWKWMRQDSRSKWTPDVDTSRTPVAILINSSELRGTGSKFKEVLHKRFIAAWLNIKCFLQHLRQMLACTRGAGLLMVSWQKKFLQWRRAEHSSIPHLWCPARPANGFVAKEVFTFKKILPWKTGSTPAWQGDGGQG
jgi:hypothetical protein